MKGPSAPFLFGQSYFYQFYCKKYLPDLKNRKFAVILRPLS